ncbi:MAG: response regulator [Deltaproteobacteria bacterium]|nr:response regulator [Deltaproteobacteria bacterium]
MIRAIVVDDELPAIDRIKKLLKPYADIDIIGEFFDGLSALSAIEEKKPDIVFLDIDMPELNGVPLHNLTTTHRTVFLASPTRITDPKQL